MSSPISIPRTSASPSSSPSLYVPVHKRTPSAYSTSSSNSPLSSPASSSRALSPAPSSRLSTPTHTPGVYTPAELLAISRSPLVAQLAASHVEALRAVAPEVVQTRKQRKAQAWHARQTQSVHTLNQTPAPHAHRRTPSRGSHSRTSEEEEERAVSWRRV